MSGTAVSATSQIPATSQESQPHPRQRRPPRGGRNGAQSGGAGRTLEPGQSSTQTTTRAAQPRPPRRRGGTPILRPATVSPGSSHIQQSRPAVVDHANTVEAARGSRGARRRGGIGGSTRGRVQQTAISGRQFGGALTAADTNILGGAQSLLQADAAVFEPGQTIATPSIAGSRPKQHQERKRRLSKSSAPDIATRVHEDIENHQYECPICTSEVLRRSKVWSCHMCWTVFHLDCIKKWSSNSEAMAQRPNEQTGEILPRQWRCPGCNLPQETKPTNYTCWCGKEHDPRSFSGLPPHSCGQTCGKSRLTPRKCPHPCELLCHAGPCPPCPHSGPTQACYCGKKSITKRCIDTDYETGWSCGQPCNETMPCGEHPCQRECHEGLCGACEVRIDGRCYCGKEEKAILCCDKDDDEHCTRVLLDTSGDIIKEEWTANFACPSLCDRPFKCGKHTCTKPCHAYDGEMADCPRSPELVTHCPCGKTPLTTITDIPRRSCEDKIPNCTAVCLKELDCGHFCQEVCHTGACLPCLQNIVINCRCGRTSLSSICHQGTLEPPQCTRVCHISLNCGRHECGERCCPGERKALDRQASRKKQRPLNSVAHSVDDGFEAEHICTRVCGRLLKCGSHTCQELCHKGACGSCREAIFEEISCHCGRTVLQPPLPCGTTSPPCRFPCERLKACGHPQVSHNCHTNDENCPKCPFLTEKECLCGKKSLKNQQCWFTDVRCGNVCGKRLKCGSHTCQKTCHKPGECEDQDTPCRQPCGKEKKTCKHPCEDPCHAPYPCREEKPCSHKILITCNCQAHKQELKCNASKTSEGNTTKSLQCDDECARLERNRRLALALDIDPATHKDDHVPYSQETLNFFQENTKWAQDQEREFRVLAGSDEEKRIRFKPMLSAQRAFLHSLAEDFGFDSESLDPEPFRHVAVFKSPRFVSAPNKTLRDCVRIRQNQKAAVVEAQTKAKPSHFTEPYNGFLLSHPRFGLTIDEIQSEFASTQGSQPKAQFDVQFLGSGDVACKVQPHGHTERTIDLTLKELKSPFARVFNSQGIGSLILCRFEDAYAITRLETDAPGEGGWSQVAAKAAAPRRAPAAAVVPEKNTYTILGNLNKRKTEAKKVKPVEAVVDDWEEVAENMIEDNGKANDQTSAATEELMSQDSANEQIASDTVGVAPSQSQNDESNASVSMT